MEKTIFDKIVDWSTERNIITAGKPSGQVLKVMEEMGEIAGGVARNKLDLIKDAVGDVLVIMTNVAKMYGVEPSSVISFEGDSFNYSDDEGLIGLIADMYSYWGDAFSFVETYDADRDFSELNDAYGSVLDVLFEIARRYNFTLQEAIEASYDVIKDRKGIFFNDVFVKEIDFTPEWAVETLADNSLADLSRNYLSEWLAKQSA